ncbi:MAG: LuxR C-terminal-related transcriptional regulator [Negativicutes bacterium]|nr:LuxR C-terminal-related transcriptional regulator [Negativicutes bacterium]
MPVTKKNRQTKGRNADLSSTHLVCTSFGNRSEIEAFIETTQKWETIATIYSVAGIDAEDFAEFVASAIRNRRKFPSVSQEKIDVRLEAKAKRSAECEKPTAREMEIMKWAARGKTCAAIAALIGVSQETVKAHIENFRSKVNATNKIEAVVLGIKYGFITID